MQLDFWDDPVVIDLASVRLDNQRIPILYDHMAWAANVVGQSSRVSVEDNKIRVQGKILDVERGDHSEAGLVIKMARAGYVWQASIGGYAGRKDFIAEGQKTTVNGREFTGPLAVARDAVIQEVSLVAIGADEQTQVLVAHRKKLRANMTPSFEDWVLSQGFTVEDLTEQQRAAMMMTYAQLYPDGSSEEQPGETPADEPAPEEEVAAQDGMEPEEEETVVAQNGEEEEEETVDQAAAKTTARRRSTRRVQASEPDYGAIVRRQVAAELEREAQIKARVPAHAKLKLKGGQIVNLRAHAIKNNWHPDKAELTYMRSSRAPNIIARSHDRDCTREAIEGALLLRCRGRLDHPAYQGMGAQALLPPWMRAGINDANRNRYMEAAHRYSDTSLLDICREACRLDGKDAPRGRNELIKAAVSGSALTNIFTTNVNAILLVSYTETGDTTEAWTTEQDVADFKTQERPRVKIGSGLAKLPRGGEADHKDYSDLVESYKIARYAAQFVVDEQDIIDDMLGALSDSPQRLGQAAAWLRPDLVYFIILNNANLSATSTALFHADQDQGTGNGNLDTSSALAAATLRTGVQRVSLFRENNRNLNLRATHLLVPPSLRHLAFELTNSSQILVSTGNTSGTERGNINALAADGLTPISEARLENGVTDPDTGVASTTHANNDWYLVSTEAHTIEVGYLRGTGRAPQVRPFVLDKGKWGVGWDVKHDIGAKALDWKGLYKGEG